MTVKIDFDVRNRLADESGQAILACPAINKLGVVAGIMQYACAARS
jgi:hypothetical protein